MALVLGIDPGSARTGWAVCNSQKVLGVGVVKAKTDMAKAVHGFLSAGLAGLKDIDKLALIVVEGQQIYPGVKQRPNDILKLGQLAGKIYGIAMAVLPTKLCMPTPPEWKGQTPKRVCQARSYAHYGIQYAQDKGYSYPTGCAVLAKVAGAARLNKGDWFEVGDAIGLARYGQGLLI